VKKILYLFSAMLMLQISIQAMGVIPDLEDAVFDGDAEAVNRALQYPNFNIMANNYGGGTLLHLAAQGATEGHVKIVQMLLDTIPEDEKPAFLMISNKYGNTALHYAASGWRVVEASYVNETRHAYMMKNQVEIIKILLETMPVNKRPVFVTKPDNHGNTALHNATYGRHTTVIKMLLDEMQYPDQRNALLIAMNNEGNTALNFAVNSFLREDAVVRALLEHYLQLGIEIPQELKENMFVAEQCKNINPIRLKLRFILHRCNHFINVTYSTPGYNLCPYCKKPLY
jgi:ankyrin repeat protein